VKSKVIGSVLYNVEQNLRIEGLLKKKKKKTDNKYAVKNTNHIVIDLLLSLNIANGSVFSLNVKDCFHVSYNSSLKAVQ